MTDRRNYIFQLNSFQILNTMSGALWPASATDSDYVYFTLRVGNQTFPTLHTKIGDLGNGTYTLNWQFGPIIVNPNDAVLLTYQIVNHGHDDRAKQAQDDIAIANKIQGTIAAVGSAAFPPAAPIIGLITGALATIEAVASWLFGAINCDGMVLSDALSVNADTLFGWTTATGVHSETRNYMGPETGSGCGSNARYAVSWSVRWSDKPKESKEHKDKEKEHKGKEKIGGRDMIEKDPDNHNAMFRSLPRVGPLPQETSGESSEEMTQHQADSGDMPTSEGSPHPSTPNDTRYF
ncbi:MAG: hypothetical protein H0X37_16305 [Herpetosiphonaceae bacterium]|nr:hypothetical protein [Herpetosiphonaceae bacterium]